MDFLVKDVFDSINTEIIFYIIIPLFDWLLVYLIYKYTSFVCKSYAFSKGKIPDLEINTKIYVISFLAIPLISYFIIAVIPSHKHSLLTHYVKILLLISAPVFVGIYNSFIHIPKMTDDEVSEYLKNKS